MSGSGFARRCAVTLTFAVAAALTFDAFEAFQRILDFKTAYEISFSIDAPQSLSERAQPLISRLVDEAFHA
jgi:hypothetical protein